MLNPCVFFLLLEEQKTTTKWSSKHMERLSQFCKCFPKINRTKIHLAPSILNLPLFTLVNHTLLPQDAHPVFCSPIKLPDKNLNTWLRLIALELLYVIDFSTVWSQRWKIYSSTSELFWFPCLWLCPFTFNSLPDFLLPLTPLTCLPQLSCLT